MKHLLIALTLAAAFASRAAAQATVASVVAPTLVGANGTYAASVSAPNLLFVGAAVYRVEVSTPVDTPVLLLSGSGQLYGVHCGSGTSSGYELTYDSNTTSGITVATTGKALHAPVYSPGQSQAAISNAQLDENESPVQFQKGLVALTHGNVLNCYIKARLFLTGTSNPNPGP